MKDRKNRRGLGAPLPDPHWTSAAGPPTSEDNFLTKRLIRCFGNLYFNPPPPPPAILAGYGPGCFSLYCHCNFMSDTVQL